VSLPHKVGMNRKQTIQKFIEAAQTDFKVLGPGKVVARSMSTLGALRLVHAQDWRDISEMFNEAMVQAGGTEVTSATLCRLYNLELKRLILIGAARSRVSVLATTPETAQHSYAPAPLMAAPNHTHTARTQHGPSNLARDGPREDLAPVELRDSPSVRDTLQMHRDINEFKQQAKRKA
jgi:hypothetical protein